MTVKIIEDKELWNKFVDESPYGLLFHKWDFLKIMEKHTKYKLLSYGIYKGNELIAIFPLFFRRYNGLKMMFSPPPQTGVPYLGFVMNHKYGISKQRRKESYLNIIVDDINEEINKISPNYVLISLIQNFLDVRQFKYNGYIADTNFTYCIDLRKSLDDIWKEFDEDCRRAIKKSAKHNFSLIQTYDVNTFYNIVSDRYGQQGLNFPIISQKYLGEIVTIFSEHVKLYFLYDNDSIIGITSHFEYKNKFIFWMGWVNLQKNLPTNEYIAWEFIKKAKTEGFVELEILGANTKRLCKFKSKFSPSLEMSFSLHKKDYVGKLAEWLYLNFIKKKII